jgi:hypothetical protein
MDLCFVTARREAKQNHVTQNNLGGKSTRRQTVARMGASREGVIAIAWAKVVSAEVDTGSGEETTSKQKDRALRSTRTEALIPAPVQDCGRFLRRARFGNSAGHCTM